MTGAGLPGADRAVLSRLVARQDDIESTLVQVRGDVDRLTRATAALTETLRRLTPTPPAADDPADDATAGEDGEAGQRDWLAVTDPDDAVAWLVEVTAWWDHVGEVLVGPSVACWPWHPRSVVAALALHAHHAQAYADPRAVAVSDLLTRWTPPSAGSSRRATSSAPGTSTCTTGAPGRSAPSCCPSTRPGGPPTAAACHPAWSRAPDPAQTPCTATRLRPISTEELIAVADLRDLTYASVRALPRYPYLVTALMAATIAVGAAAWHWDLSEHGPQIVAAGLFGWAVAAAWWWWREVLPSQTSRGAVERRSDRQQRAGGVASMLDLAQHASPAALRSRARVLRPSLHTVPRRRIKPTDIGVMVARTGLGGWGQTVWVSCEDTTLRIGGPRTGKTLSLACHGLDAPGALVTTSTRLDLAEMVQPARKDRPVHLFNPAGLGGLPSTVRWSVLVGCHDYATAARRAADLIPESASTEGERWDGHARRVLALLLHAAALAQGSVTDIQRWLGDLGSDRSGPRALAEVVDGLSVLPTSMARVSEIRQFWATNDRTRTSVMAMIAPALGWMADDACRAVGDAPSGTTTLDVARLIRDRRDPAHPRPRGPHRDRPAHRGADRRDRPPGTADRLDLPRRTPRPAADDAARRGRAGVPGAAAQVDRRLRRPQHHPAHLRAVPGPAARPVGPGRRGHHPRQRRRADRVRRQPGRRRPHRDLHPHRRVPPARPAPLPRAAPAAIGRGRRGAERVAQHAGLPVGAGALARAGRRPARRSGPGAAPRPGRRDRPRAAGHPPPPLAPGAAGPGHRPHRQPPRLHAVTQPDPTARPARPEIPGGDQKRGGDDGEVA